MAFGKRSVVSFGKARDFLEAGVDSSVLDCFKKSEVTTPNGINQRFLRKSSIRKPTQEGESVGRLLMIPRGLAPLEVREAER